MSPTRATIHRPPTAPPAMAAFLLFASSAAARAAPMISTLGAGVCDGVPVGERLGVVVDETDVVELVLMVGVCDGVMLDVIEIVGVLLAVEPVDREAVGVTVGLGVGVLDGVADGDVDAPKDREAVWLGVLVGVVDEVGLGVGPAASRKPALDAVYGPLGPVTVICAL